MADIVPSREDPVIVKDETPPAETESWIKDKLETWQESGRTVFDMGRGVMFSIMIINAAGALIFLVAGLSMTDPEAAATLGKGVELCLIGLGAATIANFAAFLMQRSVVQSATFHLIETWRNLRSDEFKRREDADKLATMMFWVVANFSVISVLLFLQGSWAAKDAIV
ncbi:MAG: hypothetical protein ACE363_14255 [Alphaproteobacteria bacterium]